MTAADLNPELRALIDARLDAIDRILIRAEIAWSERQSIVREVETQIYELLARRSEMPTKEDVMAVLDSLDPPEAYVPEELRQAFESSAEPVTPSVTDAQSWWRRTVRLLSGVSRGAACVLALVVINGAVLLILVASDGVLPWLVTLGGMVWLNYEGIRRFRAWAAIRQGNLFDDACHSLGEWLLSRGSAQAT